MSGQYVVCDRLLDPETNEHCEFDGDRPVDADGYWTCPGCHARRRVADAWTDPEPWLDPVTVGDAREVRWATVDSTGRLYYEYAPRTRAQYDADNIGGRGISERQIGEQWVLLICNNGSCPARAAIRSRFIEEQVEIELPVPEPVRISVGYPTDSESQDKHV